MEAEFFTGVQEVWESMILHGMCEVGGRCVLWMGQKGSLTLDGRFASMHDLNLRSSVPVRYRTWSELGFDLVRESEFFFQEEMMSRIMNADDQSNSHGGDEHSTDMLDFLAQTSSFEDRCDELLS